MCQKQHQKCLLTDRSDDDDVGVEDLFFSEASLVVSLQFSSLSRLMRKKSLSEWENATEFQTPKRFNDTVSKELRLRRRRR